MHELFPLIAGVAVGLAVHRLARVWLKAVVLIVLSAAFGTIAAFVSGELSESLAYLVFDTGQVLLAAVAAMLLSTWGRRWLTRVR